MPANKILKSKVVMVFLFVLALGVAFSVAKELRERYAIETQVADLQQQILGLENRNSELTGLVSYFESSEYREREARRKLNLQLPGERVVVIPPQTEAIESTVMENNVEEQANFVKWWEYFFKKN